MDKERGGERRKTNIRERKTVRERKKRGGKKKGDFPGVLIVGA